MKIFISLILIGVFSIMWSMQTNNPFYSEWQTPYGIPDFSKVENEHYMPAFKDGIKELLEEIEKSASNPEGPTFDNTITAMEKGGKLLTRVSNVFFNLSAAHTNDALQAIQKEVSPLLSSMRDDINLNPKLFARIKTLYDNKKNLNLTVEQEKLLDDNFKSINIACLFFCKRMPCHIQI